MGRHEDDGRLAQSKTYVSKEGWSIGMACWRCMTTRAKDLPGRGHHYEGAVLRFELLAFKTHPGAK